MTQTVPLDRLAAAVVISMVLPNAEEVPADLLAFCLEESASAGGRDGLYAIPEDVVASRVCAVLRSLAFPDTSSADDLRKMRAAYAVLNYEHQTLRAAEQRLMSEMPIGPGASPSLIALGGHAYRPTAT